MKVNKINFMTTLYIVIILFLICLGSYLFGSGISEYSDAGKKTLASNLYIVGGLLIFLVSLIVIWVAEKKTFRKLYSRRRK